MHTAAYEAKADYILLMITGGCDNHAFSDKWMGREREANS